MRITVAKISKPIPVEDRLKYKKLWRQNRPKRREKNENPGKDQSCSVDCYA